MSCFNILAHPKYIIYNISKSCKSLNYERTLKNAMQISLKILLNHNRIRITNDKWINHTSDPDLLIVLVSECTVAVITLYRWIALQVNTYIYIYIYIVKEQLRL